MDVDLTIEDRCKVELYDPVQSSISALSSGWALSKNSVQSPGYLKYRAFPFLPPGIKPARTDRKSVV